MFRLSSAPIELSNVNACLIPVADDERNEVEFWRAEAGVAREEAVAAHKRLETQEEHIVAVLQQTAEVKRERERVETHRQSMLALPVGLCVARWQSRVDRLIGVVFGSKRSYARCLYCCWGSL